MTSNEATLEECSQCGAMVQWHQEGKLLRMSQRHSAWHREAEQRAARIQWAYMLSLFATGMCLGLLLLMAARGS